MKEKGFPLNPPEPYRARTWWEYATLPGKRTGCVVLKQVGIVHGPLDMVSCMMLAVPGILFSLLLDDSHGVSCTIRVLVALESGIIATVSVLSDGLLTVSSNAC